jgi:hypothetical protein
LFSILREVTAEGQITGMLERDKFRHLLSVFLGNQSVRGWFRPRDLIFDRGAIDAIRFAGRLNDYILDLPGGADDAGFDSFFQKPPIRIRSGKDGQGISVGEFALSLGLLLMAEENKPAANQDHLRRWYRVATSLLLKLAEYFPAGDSQSVPWGVDVSRCCIELEIPPDEFLNSIRCLVAPKGKGYPAFKALVKGLLDGSKDLGLFDVVAVRSIGINRCFLARWDNLSMKRGASYLAYAAIAILREELVSELGPQAIVHDFGGWLYFVAPAGCGRKYDGNWIDKTLAGSFERGGWMHGRYREILDRPQVLEAFRDERLRRACFQRLEARVLTQSPVDINGLRGFRDKTEEQAPENKVEDEAGERIPTGSDVCPHCGQYPLVEGKFRRWKMKDRGERGCAVCTLIADGAAPWSRYHLWASAIEESSRFHSKSVVAYFHEHTTENVSENGEAGFFCADGDGVGEIIRSARGIHALRHISLQIHSDLQYRLRAAIEECIEGIQDGGTFGFELCWIGGDDLMMRLRPSNRPVFEKHFAYRTPLSGKDLTFTTGWVKCRNDHEEYPAAMAKALDQMHTIKKGKAKS